MGDRNVDLLQQVDQGPFVDKGPRVVFSSSGSPALRLAELGLELLEERVGDLLDHDEALRGATGLPGVVHPSPDGPLHGVFEICVLEHDERVATAELHRGRLEVLAGPGRDAPAGRHAAGEGHTLYPRILDEVVGLLVRDQKIGVEAGGCAGVDPQLLEGDGALRHDACVLHQQDIAGHQVRTGDPGKLVVGEVPGLHAEDHADRAALHVSFAERRMELHRSQETLGVLGVVGEDV